MDWSTAGLMRRLRLPEDFVPSSGVEMEQIYERCVDLLLAPGTKSGYKEVYPSATEGKWQAKPYIGPGKQRNLGTFATARAAAKAILWFKQGGCPAPSPQKERNKRGQGARARDRRKGTHRCHIHCMHAPAIADPSRMLHRSQFLEWTRGRRRSRAPAAAVCQLGPQRLTMRTGAACLSMHFCRPLLSAQPRWCKCLVSLERVWMVLLRLWRP